MKRIHFIVMLLAACLAVQAQPKSRIVEDGGTGPYKAVMQEETTLSAHTVFVPQDLSPFSAAKPLPVLVWGNGACSNSPWEHYKFLNEIASHGYIVVATGFIPMDDEPYHGPMSTTQQQIESIDWICAQNADEKSPYYQKIDTRNICVAGMSCGGLQTLFNCADPRIKTLMICNSGLFNQQNANQAVGGMPMPPKDKLKEIHSPIIYILGGPQDIAYENGMDDFRRISHVPACATNFPVGHGGTYREPHGGEFTIVALAWLDWQLKGDAEAAKMFKGDDCGLSKRKGWTIEKNQLLSQLPTSPNGKLAVIAQGAGYVLQYEGQTVLEIPAVGYGNSATPAELRFVRRVTADYTMLAGKRLHCTNEANEYEAATGEGVLLTVRLYNDGLAFRYELADVEGKLPDEQTVYRIPDGTRRWMQQWSEAYEGFFPLTTDTRVKAEPSFSRPSLSPEGYNRRWGYPSLLEPSDGVFALISEANIERRQSASCLYNEGDRYRVVPDENGAALSGRWHSPWRVVIVGRLNDVVESTLVTDVSEPCRLNDVSWIHPGVVSWIYWAYNHGSNDYDIIRKYVDMAVTLRLPYVLIDAEWDEMKDGKTIEQAVSYAKSCGIKPLIWYNSSIGWINGAPGPKFRLNKPEDREREFAWCERIGVAGVKIDFFSGDNQANMDYCLDLLESAARHHLLVNFHGATIPRGWQRTYPNLLTTEAVYGAEWYNNVPTFTSRAARHNATLPFTRNVIGPMDYTPCTFSDSQHPHITTHAHELALTVLYESGLQHLADRPESYLSQPAEVQQFLSRLPAVWDETRFVSGYPGERVVMARRSGSAWYIAGINGSDEAQVLTLPADCLPAGLKVTQAFFDAADKKKAWDIRTKTEIPERITCQPRGGFVLVAE